MPPKIRELERRLKRNGFEKQSGKGSHRKYKHPHLQRPVIISGQPGDDAQSYQEEQVAQAIRDIGGTE